MKYMLLILMTIVTLAGCASVDVNMETGEIDYTRIGDQHIQGLTFEKTADGGLRMTLEGQQSEASALNDALSIIGTMSRSAGETP